MKNMNSEHFIADSLSEWKELGGGVRRQILGYDEKLMAVKVSFETGSVGAVHKHPHSQSSYVASGRFEVCIGGEKRRLGPGDGFYAAPGQEHGVVCLESGVLVDTFAPCRLDFLE